MIVFLFLFLDFSFAQSATNTIPISSADKKILSRLIPHANLNFPESIPLKKGTADLSGFIQEINKTRASLYDDTPDLISLSNILIKYVKQLCDQTHNRTVNCYQSFDSFSDSVQEIVQNKSQKILYPPGYIAKEPFTDSDFSKAGQALDSECPQNCSNDSLLKALKYSSQQQYKSLLSKITDPECAKDIINNFKEQGQNESFPKACLNKKNKNHTVCQNMQKHFDTLKKRVFDLLSLAYNQEVWTEAGFCSQCLQNKELESIESLADSIKDREQCLELGPGAEKKLTGNESWPTDYLLKRGTDGVYHIDFPIEFYIAEDYNGTKQGERALRYYRGQVEKCLKEAQPMMKGPKGEKIRLSISQAPADESPAKPCPKAQTQSHRIGIGATNIRSSHTKYSADIDCPTIVHEILHLTGLCDEYQEKGNGFYVDPHTGEVTGNNFRQSRDKNKDHSKDSFELAYDCRVLSENSIMSDANKRWEYAKKNKISLLSPGHFNHILYGSCPDKNKKFQECQALSYKSSWENTSENLGEKAGENSLQNCHVKKRECERNNGLGLNKQEELDFITQEIQNLEEQEQEWQDEEKMLKEKGWFDLTSKKYFEEEYKKALAEKHYWQQFLSSKNLSEKNKQTVNNNIQIFIDKIKDLKTFKKHQQEAGLWNSPILGEITQDQLKDIQTKLQWARQRQQLVQSWLDP